MNSFKAFNKNKRPARAPLTAAPPTPRHSHRVLWGRRMAPRLTPPHYRPCRGHIFPLRSCGSSSLMGMPRLVMSSFWCCSAGPPARVFSMSRFSSSMSLFSLARRFWNQVITCALERPSDCAISSRSAGDRYFWYRKRFSSSKIWWLVKAVRDLRFFLTGGRAANMLAPSPAEGERVTSWGQSNRRREGRRNTENALCATSVQSQQWVVWYAASTFSEMRCLETRKKNTPTTFRPWRFTYVDYGAYLRRLLS